VTMIFRSTLIIVCAIALVAASGTNGSADEHPGVFLSAGSKAGCFDSISNIKLMLERGLARLDNANFVKRHGVYPAGGTPFGAIKLGTLAHDGDLILVRITAGRYAGTTCWAISGGVDLK
jgi:hypothetical protein